MRRIAAAVVVAAVVGCTPSSSPFATASNTKSSALSTSRTKPYVRPRAMTLQIPVEQVLSSGGVDNLLARPAQQQTGWNPFFTPGGAPLPVYLERNQITYTGGADNSSTNRSSVVGSGSATVSAYAGSDTQWNQIVSCVQSQFARFNVTVTDVEPASGEYIEAKFGGTPGQVGLPNGVGGVAPIDSFSCNIIPRAVVFTFSGVLGNSPQINCEVAAQEIAHAFSLDHEFLCEDPMTYLSGCGAKTFQDEAAQCGEFEPRQCNCGRASHNSVQIMLNKLGGSAPLDPDDVVPPAVTIVSPADDATLEGGTQSAPGVIEIVADATDDGTIVATELIWPFNGSVFPCPGEVNGGAVSCTRTGNRSTWTLNVGSGDRTFSVRALDAGGNETISPERTIHLTVDGVAPPPPPNDDVPPVVSITSPADGAELLANSTMTVVATASDDQGLEAVELTWPFANTVFPCPLNSQNVSCTQSGNTFTWELNVGVGARAFTVRATDLAGNVTESAEREINLVTDPSGEPPPPPDGDNDAAEPNDSAADAFGTRCGNAIDLVASPGDEDWFSIEATAGSDVIVGVAGSGSLALTLFRADGTTQLASNNDVAGSEVTARAEESIVMARLTTAEAASTSYRLAVSCGNNDVPPPPEEDDELEPNDQPGGATRSFCGQERSGLAAINDDYYVVAVREGDTLTVELDNGGATATIIDEDGSELVAPGTEVSAAGLAEGDVLVRVTPQGDGTVYGISIECSAGSLLPPSANPAPTCAAGSGTVNDTVFVAGALAALLVVVRRRRRR